MRIVRHPPTPLLRGAKIFYFPLLKGAKVSSYSPLLKMIKSAVLLISPLLRGARGVETQVSAKD